MVKRPAMAQLADPRSKHDGQRPLLRRAKTVNAKARVQYFKQCRGKGFQVTDSRLRRPQVIGEITLAFADTRYPGDRRALISPDPALRSPEVEDLYRILASQRWQDVRAEELARNSELFCYLTPAGRRYYLPALLIAALEDAANPAGWDLLGTVIGYLKPPRLTRLTAQSPQEFRETFSTLSPAQRDAVRSFLRFVGLHIYKQVEWGAGFRAAIRFWLDDELQQPPPRVRPRRGTRA